MTYLFLAILAATLALGGWLIVSADADLPFHRLSDRAARKSASEIAARVVSPRGARRTPNPPAPLQEPAQWTSCTGDVSTHPGVGSDQ